MRALLPISHSQLCVLLCTMMLCLPAVGRQPTPCTQHSIARNRARLLALDIPQAVANLTKLAPTEKPRQPRQVSAQQQHPLGSGSAAVLLLSPGKSHQTVLCVLHKHRHLPFINHANTHK